MSPLLAFARRWGPGLVAVLALALPGRGAWADPPGLAGRLSALEGSATLQQGDAPPQPAALNWPVTGGERLLTAPGARLELRVGATALQLDGDTALDVDALDEQRVALRLEHGRLALRVRSGEEAHALALSTPQGRLSVSGPGRWRVEAGLAPDTSSVAALDAPAEFLGNDDGGTHATVQPGHRLRVSGQRVLALQDLPLDTLAFDRWVAEREAHDDLGASAQYVSPAMTGAEDLDRFGAWSVTADWGPVWFPAAIGIDWAPYRVGRWAWVAPWGWTWVDAAPWGFAPFHYGRWALVEGRWGWVPGSYVARPVYAPALVGWIGGPGWSLSATLGPSVGWFPLAPREPYVPAFDASVAYVRRLNVGAVRDVTRIDVNMDLRTVQFANRALPRAVTVVPSAEMAAGHDVARAALPLRDARSLSALPVVARAPLAPPAHAALALHAPRPQPPALQRAEPPRQAAEARPQRPLPPAVEERPWAGRELAAPPALHPQAEPPHDEIARERRPEEEGRAALLGHRAEPEREHAREREREER
jgi:hypothetical protein